MKVLCIGDIVGRPGRDAVEKILPELRKEFSPDVIIANAENSAGGAGVTSRIANIIFGLGCDVLTSGDHIWDKSEVIEYIKETPSLIRPANFPAGTPGEGWYIHTDRNKNKIGVINLLGRVFMRYNVECPFRTLEKIVAEIKKQTNVIIVDIHAEATSEKVALGHFIDGQVSAVYGTHTHIQTADDHILPLGTAFICDLGMTGPYDSVIGQNKEKIIQRFLTSLPTRFEVALDDICLSGIYLDIDEKTGRTREIKRLQRRLQ